MCTAEVDPDLDPNRHHRRNSRTLTGEAFTAGEVLPARSHRGRRTRRWGITVTNGRGCGPPPTCATELWPRAPLDARRRAHSLRGHEDPNRCAPRLRPAGRPRDPPAVGKLVAAPARSSRSRGPRMNLAANLTATADRHGARTALSLGDTVLTYEQLDAASARVAGMLLERGLRPGDRVGVMLPNVPRIRNGLLRRAAHGRNRRSDEPAAQAARGRPLRRGLRRGPDPRRRGSAARRRRARPRRGRARHRRHGRDPLHVGHHGPAEGRGAHARQPRPQRRGHARPALDRARRRRARRAAAVPLVRADGRAQPRGRLRREPRAAAALPSRRRARPGRASQGHGVRGRADDVRGAAQPARPRPPRHVARCASACPAERRSRSRSCMASRRRSAA